MTGITLSTDTYKEKPLIFRKSSVTVFPFFSRIHVYHNLLICDTSTFDNSAEYTFFIAEEIRVNFYFVVHLSLDEIFFFFFFDRRCKFVLSLSFVFFFYYYYFPSDISGRTRGVLGHPQKWRITVNVNFWGAERVKRCVYRRLSRGIYFVCCWRGKYFLRVQWRLNEMPKFFLETSSVC